MDFSHSRRVIVVGFLLVNSALGRGISDLGMTQGTAEPRVLHFPQDRSLGMLMSRPARPDEPVNSFPYRSRDDDWELLGRAQSDLFVPAGRQVLLTVSRSSGWRDLSPLLKLKPDDLYRLSIHGSYSGGGRPGDSCMRYIEHLTGLRSLDLHNTSVSGSAMKYISRFTELRRLTVPGRVDDRGMVHIAELPSLTGLYFKENQVTNAGLVHLAKLTSLEELELGGARLTDEGLSHLAGLPQRNFHGQCPDTPAEAAEPDIAGFHVRGEFHPACPQRLPREHAQPWLVPRFREEPGDMESVGQAWPSRSSRHGHLGQQWTRVCQMV